MRIHQTSYGPLLLAVMLSWASLTALASDIPVFDQAQVAATEGRYEDVVNLLTGSIVSGSLDQEDLAVALGNRGIAFSLLEQYDAAYEDLERAVSLKPDHLLTLNHLGILAEHVDQDFERAAGWYRRAADLGYPASQVNLGNLFRFGLGVERNLPLAVALYEAAAAEDYSVAFVALGEMYMDGMGVEKDFDKGLELLRRGVDRGVVTGHYYLGLAYSRGEGVGQDYETALLHLREAAIKGHAPSQGEIGYMYRKGFGVDKDFLEAAKWYRLAAEQGDVTAANRLAWLMATCPIAAVCNGRVALEFARFAVGSDRSATNLDSLAAAHARLGEFNRAMEVISEIIAMPTLSESTQRKYARRLERYRNGIPFQL